jgi:outer membrane autotransporter protein
MLQAAVHARTNFDAAYIAAALAYALHDFTTDRYLTVPGPGIDHLRAEFVAHNFAGQIEGGYRIALPDLHGAPGEGSITPYAGLRVQSLHTPAYSEFAVSGSDDLALAYDARSATTVRSELGARFERVMPIHDEAMLTLRSRIAWAHDYSSNTSVTAMFVGLPGESFAVNGAAAGADSLLLSAGAEVKLNSGLSVAGLFDSAFAEGSHTYTGTARVRYAW